MKNEKMKKEGEENFDVNNLTTDKENKPIQIDEDDLKRLVKDNVKKEIQNEIAVDKASLFTVFGIFASIVTFVSVEIQILKTVCSFWKLTGFSLIFLSSLLMFVLLLDYIGRGWRNDFKLEIKKFPWIIFLIIVLFFITGLLLSFLGNEQSCKENAIFKRYENNFIEKQIEIEGICDDQIKNLKKELTNNLEDKK